MKKILSIKEMENLSTARLLSYKKNLPYPGKKYDNDSSQKEKDKIDLINFNRQKHIEEVKSILSKREHLH